MKTFRYKNAIVNMHGKVDREKLEAATIKFMKKVERSKRKNDNENKTRAVS